MADEVEEKKEESKKKSGMGMGAIIGIIAGAIVLQGVLIIVIWVFFLKPDTPTDAKNADDTEQTASEENGEEDGEDGEEDHTIGHIIQMDEMIINPKGSPNRYVALEIGLEVNDEEEAATIDGSLIAIKDRIIRTITSRTLDDLQKSELRDTLRDQLRTELQPYFGEATLRKVYFSKFIIQ